MSISTSTSTRSGAAPAATTRSAASRRIRAISLRRRRDDRSLDGVAHERQRDADRRDDLGVARDAARNAHAFGYGGTSAPAPPPPPTIVDALRVELVVGDEPFDRGAHLFRGDRENVASERERIGAEILREQLEGAARRRRVASREGARRNRPEHVCGAGDGRRDAPPVAGDEHGVFRSVARRRGDALDARAVERVGRDERGVGASGDVRAARADVANRVAAETHHAAAADSERAHVERAQHRAMTADARRMHLRPSRANRGAIGARAPDLDEDPLAQPFVEQRPGDARGRTREQRQDRPPLDLAHVHDAAVAAHHHQRRGNCRALDGAGRDARRANHFRKNRGVEGRGARARAQAVRRADVVAARRIGAARSRVRDRKRLGRGPVDAEALAGRDCLRAGADEPVDGGAHRPFVASRRECKLGYERGGTRRAARFRTASAASRTTTGRRAARSRRRARGRLRAARSSLASSSAR